MERAAELDPPRASRAVVESAVERRRLRRERLAAGGDSDSDDDNGDHGDQAAPALTPRETWNYMVCLAVRARYARVAHTGESRWSARATLHTGCSTPCRC